MSGHSKWHSIRHKKAAEDKKRGAIFSKVIREITVAARQGGGDPESNPRLRTAIETARSVNMPSENIERAIKRGTGELSGGLALEELVYEGYGPEGVALYIEAMTDNKNRTTPEIKKILSKYGGSLGETGCVAWMFEKRGVIILPTSVLPEEKMLEVALEVGAEDMEVDGGYYSIKTSPDDFASVCEALRTRGIEPESAGVQMVPKTTVKVESPPAAERILRLMEALEEHDDVQNVYANFDIPDEILESFKGEG